MQDFISIETFLQAVLAMIMLSVGLSLTAKDFQYIVENPRITIIGLFLKMFCFPFIGVSIANLLGLSTTFQLGIFILLICPVGTTSNLITYWFSGNKALTVALTTIASFVAVITVPILTRLAYQYYFGDNVTVNLPVWGTIANIFIVLILPVLVGMLFRWRYERQALFTERVLKYASIVLLAVVYIIKFFAPKENGGTEISREELFTLLPVLLAINATALLFGFVASRLLKINNQDSMTIGIEMGLENVSLAIVVGSVLLHNEDLVKPGLIYAMFSFWTVMGFAVLTKKLFYEKRWL
ncbi:MAG: bile acid:sodium symporter family protein [Saprospiraceae bacterium]|nr:bile acid:sodium symporter family protein [Saprospiraceae bacterium]